MVDSTDGGRSSGKSWRIISWVFRKLLSLRLTKKTERKIYPRLELPPVDLHFEYEMTHKNRGIALVFNHEYFALVNKKRRTGTHMDRERLLKSYGRLNFDIRIFDDLPSKAMMKKLLEVSRMDHTDSDCLMVTILTHGDFGTISSYDENYNIKRITSLFTDDKCPTLKGKPRLFFIQACRGIEKDVGHTVTMKRSLHRGNHSVNRSPLGFFDTFDISTCVTPPSDDGIDDQLHDPPIEKDFLIVRSTVPNYISFRNAHFGTWFIQVLCDELDVNGTTHSIMDLLTHVNWRVSELESFPNREKQTLCISSMLTKILIFNDKQSVD